MKWHLNQKDTSQDNEASLLSRQPFKGSHSHKSTGNVRLTLSVLLRDKCFPTGKPLLPTALYSGASEAKEEHLLRIASLPRAWVFQGTQVYPVPATRQSILVNSKTKVIKHEFCFETFSCLLQIT